MSNSTTSPRLLSIDQFRGYSVAAMFIVNFVGGLAVTHHVLKHNNTHFSYADSIMPSFIFICGFSYRMTWLKRIADIGRQAATATYLRRSLALLLLSLILTAFNSKFKTWNEMTTANVLKFVSELLKANLWEVLGIIGAIQILLIPLIGKASLIRATALLGFAVLHAFLSWSFNYEFVYGRPNWMDAYFGAAGKRAWDGGFFGLISWAEIMLAGTLAHDMVMGKSVSRSTANLASVGLLMMLLGYGMSCMTRLYDITNSSAEQVAVAQSTTAAVSQVALDPVLPPFQQAAGRAWTDLLAEPPLVPPPPATARQFNYWMMDKRIVTQSFVFFSSGVAMFLFALFRYACDGRQCAWWLFDVFGKNPLAAYIIHHLVAVAILAIVPSDSSLAWSLLGLAIYFGITLTFVLFLDRRKLYLRL